MAVMAALFHARRRPYTFLLHHPHQQPENNLNAWLKPFTIALAFAGLAPTASHAADAAAIKALVDRTIPPLMAQYGVPGMAIAVTVNGKAMFFNYGVASKEKNTPVNQQTLFELGSVSKTFTATLAGYAQALGKLELDDHPDKYLPQLKGSPIAAATLLDLGAYAAGGLPLQVPDQVKDDTQLLAYLRDWKPEAAPGVTRRYSNPSIGLLGRATAIALKESFSDAAEKTLFPALGMKHTYTHVPAAAMAHYAWGYDKTDSPVRVRPDVLDMEAYGVKSSTSDLIRYVQLNIDPTQLKGPIRGALESTHVGYFQIGDMVQGLGWEQYRSPLALQRLVDGNSSKMSGETNPATKFTSPQAPRPGTLFNKTGSTRGFGSYVAFIPEKKTGIVMLSNKFYPNAERIKAAYAILEQLAPLD
jgi:beta-lactamase class C